MLGTVVDKYCDEGRNELAEATNPEGAAMIAKRTMTLTILFFLFLPFGMTASTATAQHANGSDLRGRNYADNHRGYTQDHDRRHRKKVHVRDDHHRQKTHRRYPAKVMNLRRKHLPPVGYCRVWFPDRPAGHQPAPVPCKALHIRHVPSHAVILTHKGISSRWYRNRRTRSTRIVGPAPRWKPRVEIRWDVRGGWIIGR